MKLNFGKRLILFAHWLVSVALLAAVAFAGITEKWVESLRGLIGASYTHIAFIAFAVLYALLCLAVVCIIFRRDGKRSERGFITVDSSDTGRVRIAVGAIEQMVEEAAGTVQGIADMRISITSADDAIVIGVNISLYKGTHVPTVTLEMQRAIRQFVEMNCGVAVRSVSINIQSVTDPAETGRKGRRAAAKNPVPAPVIPVPVPPVEEVLHSDPVAYAPEPEQTFSELAPETPAEPSEAYVPAEEPVAYPEEAPEQPEEEKIFE